MNITKATPSANATNPPTPTSSAQHFALPLRLLPFLLDPPSSLYFLTCAEMTFRVLVAQSTLSLLFGFCHCDRIVDHLQMLLVRSSTSRHARLASAKRNFCLREPNGRLMTLLWSSNGQSRRRHPWGFHRNPSISAAGHVDYSDTVDMFE